MLYTASAHPVVASPCREVAYFWESNKDLINNRPEIMGGHRSYHQVKVIKLNAIFSFTKTRLAPSWPVISAWVMNTDFKGI